MAYAAHCQQEVAFDRPVAGHMNICPGSIVNGTTEIEGLTSTVKHELLHALGFSMSLFAFFRYLARFFGPQESTLNDLADPSMHRVIVIPVFSCDMMMLNDAKNMQESTIY